MLVLFYIVSDTKRYNSIESFDALITEAPHVAIASHHPHDMSASYQMEVVGYCFKSANRCNQQMIHLLATHLQLVNLMRRVFATQCQQLHTI